ncbi:Permease of the major facilitator superfamily [Candidatus Paraburkholderia calva]|nr:Permease of the major facilitator superfamily [Candidatus Paraburkholderia calva]
MQTVLNTGAPLTAAPPLSNSQVRRAVLASIIGNGLEWFDFLIYGYFAKTIAHVFFPLGNNFLSITLTLSTFAIGFIVRPLGGIAIGAWADRYGHRKTLSAAAMLTEYAPPGRKMFFGSFQMTSQAVALLLSSSCGYLLTTNLSAEALASWGWRVPFLLGALVGPIGFYIRHKVSESPEFMQLRQQLGHAPHQSLRAFFRERSDAALCAMGVIIVSAATNYL